MDNQDSTTCWGLTISHNTIAHCGRSNIAIIQGTWPGSRFNPKRMKILYNDLGPCAYTTAETGSINGQSSWFVEVGYNWFHGVAGHNQSYIGTEYDRGGDHWTIHHNVFYQGETVIKAPLGNWSTNGSADTAGGKGFYYINNTFVDSVGPQHRNISALRWPVFMKVPGVTSATYPGKKNNLFVWTEADTLWNSPWKYADYQFTDTANHDYSLRAGSPAIDKGVVVPGITESFKGSAPDLGAYEYGDPRWVAGADWQEQPWVYPPGSNSAQPGRLVDGTGLMSPRLLLTSRHILVSAPAGTAYTVGVLDALGRLRLIANRNKGGIWQMQTDVVPKGVYLIKVSSKAGTLVQRAVVHGENL
jgi:hypothetical protein